MRRSSRSKKKSKVDHVKLRDKAVGKSPTHLELMGGKIKVPHRTITINGEEFKTGSVEAQYEMYKVLPATQSMHEQLKAERITDKNWMYSKLRKAIIMDFNKRFKTHPKYRSECLPWLTSKID